MAKKHPLLTGIDAVMIKKVPAYGNKFFYSLGFLSATAFVMLIISGVIMAAFGPDWWLTSSLGSYVRSVHLWSTQAFVIFILLHMLIVFFTSGFKKPRRLTWMLGVLMLFVVLAETEFGYVLRGDYSSQWRSLQGADFYNGAGLGNLLNPLSYGQIYGIHIALIPLTIVALLSVHYLLVRVLGIAKPYRKDVVVSQVPANHTVLFVRGGVLALLVLVLAALFPSPYIQPVTIQSIAQDDPQLIGRTLVAEFDKSSDTATYLDNIDPYTFDTQAVYINNPYQQYRQIQATTYPDALKQFEAEASPVRQQQLQDATDYYSQSQPPDHKPQSPVLTVTSDLISMSQTGLYQDALTDSAAAAHIDAQTAVNRFLSDTGVLEDKATLLGITTDQYGMIREERGNTPGAWWLAPIGLLNHTVLANDDNGDRDAAIIFGSLLLTLLAFPFIPYLNQLPEVLHIAPLIWRSKRRS